MTAHPNHDRTMRTAFLVLAHDQPAQLSLLARSLTHPDTVCFVHVDARSGSLEPFAAGLPASARLLPTRRAVHWGGISMVHATLDLMRAAVRWGADRLVLLSGSDLLARPLSELLHALDSPTEFLRIERPVRPVSRHKIDRLHFSDADARWLRGLSGRLPRLRRGPVEWVQGSQWWALTGPCARMVLARLEAEPQILSFLARSHCPDEIAITSVIADSAFAAAVSHDHREQVGPRTGRYALHYIDWQRHTALSPKVLDEHDLGAIVESGAYFARKIRLPHSQRLVRELAARTEEVRLVH